jgi:hypothetical protein
VLAAAFKKNGAQQAHLCTLKKGGCNMALGMNMAFVSRL